MGSAAISDTVIIAAACSVTVAFVYHWLVVRPRFRAHLDRSGNGQTAVESAVETAAAADLRSRVAALEAASAQALRYVGFVRFNAFEDVGSELSYALAVVDSNGNGFLVTSIYSREEVRTYAKAVRSFGADKEVSIEERRALQLTKQQARLA